MSCYSMIFMSNGVPLRFRDLKSAAVQDDLALKTPRDLDKTPQLRENRMKTALYQYSEMKDYLKGISFKCMGFGNHI